MGDIGSFAVPILVAAIIICGLFRCKKIFSVFIDGAQSGFKVIISLAPSLIGLITAVEMFKASGALDILTRAAAPAAEFLHIPPDIIPLIILRPISGSGSIALLDRVLSTCGPDSAAGRVACVLCASSETTFYTTTTYFGAVGVRRIRHTLAAAIIADFVGIIVSTLTVGLIFG